MNVSGTTISATGHKGGLGDGLYDRAGARPDLDLDFARTKSLKDRVSKEDLITFTRSAGGAKAATYVDENGLIKVARHNLVHNSHNISLWSKSSTTTLTANAATAPDGTNTATKVVVQTGTGADQFRGITDNNNNIDPKEVEVIWSIYLKSAVSDGSNQVGILSLTGSDRRVITITNQWQRFELKASRAGSGSTDFDARFGTRTISSNGSMSNRSHTGNTNETIEVFAWGAQMEVIHNSSTPDGLVTGLATELIKTTTQGLGAPRFTHDPVTKESKGLLIEQAATNLVKNKDANSSDFTKEGLNTVYLGTAPTGVTEANELVASSSYSTKQIYHTVPNGSLSALKYTYSVFLKKGQIAAPGNYDQIAGIRIGQSGAKAHAEVNLTDGTINVTIGTGAIENYGNDWYRATITTATALSSSSGCNVFVYVKNSTGQAIYTGAGESIYFYGPQLEAGEITTSYIPTFGAVGGVTRSPDLVKIDGDNFGTYRKNLLTNTSFRKGSDGYILTGPNANATYESYAGISPSGNYDALKMTATSGTGTHRILQYVTLDDSSLYSVSAYVKAGSSDKCIVSLWDGNSTVGQVRADLTAKSAQNIGGINATNVDITDVGNDWYLIEFTSISTTVSGPPAVYVNVLNDANSQTYAGNGESIFVWGIQVVKANTPSEFIPSTDTYTNRQSNATFVDNNGVIRTSYANLMPYSEDLSQSSSFEIHSSHKGVISTNAGTAPDGSSADAFIGQGQTGRHSLTINPTITRDNNHHTFSVFVKRLTGSSAERYVNLETRNYGSWTYTGTSGTFDLETGTRLINPTGVGGDNITSGIEDVGNGWYRIYMTSTTDTAESNTGFYINRTDSGNSYTSLTIPSNEGILVWGAQVVRGAVTGDYYKTTGTISGPPRYSHDPETLTPTGLYLEPAATNYALQSERFDLTDSNNGEPWSKGGSSFTTDNSVTNPDGTTGALKLIPDSTNTRSHISYFLDTTTASSDTITLSVFVKAAGYNRVALISQVGGNNSRGVSFDLTTGTIQSSHNATGEIHKYPNGWFRIVVHPTTSVNADYYVIEPHSSSSASVVDGTPDPSNYFRVTYSGDPSTGDGMYLWGAQLEETANVTSYIPTKDSQGNRTADIFTSTATEVLDRANGTKPAFFNPSAYTFGTKFTVPNVSYGSQNTILAVTNTDASVDERSEIRHTGNTGKYRITHQIPSIALNLLALDNRGAVNLQEKAVGAYNGTNYRASANGELETSTTVVAAQTGINKALLGARPWDNGTVNTTIQRVYFWKTCLTDDNLKKITT